MSFVSYAQNFEDVMLWRALKEVKEGFYIDVGANDPSLYSVTKSFYDRNWKGLNLEPVGQFYEKLCLERPRDINLQLGAGENQGKLSFFDIPNTGLATTDPDVAAQHRNAGWSVNEVKIPIRPLRDICEEYAEDEIHFLKVDVEGAERSVLLGMDFSKYRPWIVVVEATRPMSSETAHEAWEPLLLEADYDFVYFDGLNRFYIAREHENLKGFFSVPPNVFDAFVLNADQEARIRVEEAEARAAQSRQIAQYATGRMQQVEADCARRCKQAEDEVADCNRLVASIYASTSWRATMPLRALRQPARYTLVLLGHAKKRLRRFAGVGKTLLMRIMRKLLSFSLVRRVAVMFFSRFPKIKNRLISIRQHFVAEKDNDVARHSLPALTIDAQRVLSDLPLPRS